MLPRFTATEATLSGDIVGVEFNLKGLSDNVVHISGFRGEDGRIVEMNAVSLVDTVFSYGPLVRMIQSYLSLISFNLMSTERPVCRTHRGSCKPQVSLASGGL
jgi:hypothetical protein